MWVLDPPPREPNDPAASVSASAPAIRAIESRAELLALLASLRLDKASEGRLHAALSDLRPRIEAAMLANA